MLETKIDPKKTAVLIIDMQNDLLKGQSEPFNMLAKMAQAKGIIKYCKPKKHLIRAVNTSLNILNNQGDLNLELFLSWVKNTNRIWLKYIKIRNKSFLFIILNKIKKKINNIFNI